MMRLLAWLSGCVLLAAAGLVHGLWTDRWGVAADVTEAAARVHRMPADVGEWRGSPVEVSADDMARVRVTDYCARMYEHRRKRQAVLVFLVCGRPGPVAVHTPDICYQGAGYEMAAAPVPFSLDGTDTANFQTTAFRKLEPVTSGDLRIFWTWNANGRWEAPSNPRWSFARAAALYKLYVVREKRPRERGKAEDDPCFGFLKEYLPELDRALFPQGTEE